MPVARYFLFVGAVLLVLLFAVDALVPQGAVVASALRGAEGRADIAIATTEPGSVSQRTFERFGFQVLYTRAILVRS